MCNIMEIIGNEENNAFNNDDFIISIKERRTKGSFAKHLKKALNVDLKDSEWNQWFVTAYAQSL